MLGDIWEGERWPWGSRWWGEWSLPATDWLSGGDSGSCLASQSLEPPGGSPHFFSSQRAASSPHPRSPGRTAQSHHLQVHMLLGDVLRNMSLPLPCWGRIVNNRTLSRWRRGFGPKLGGEDRTFGSTTSVKMYERHWEWDNQVWIPIWFCMGHTQTPSASLSPSVWSNSQHLLE